jgi:hypothetical protein
VEFGEIAPAKFGYKLLPTFKWLIGKAFRGAEVTKMINVYRAPISDSEAKAIVDFLTKTY